MAKTSVGESPQEVRARLKITEAAEQLQSLVGKLQAAGHQRAAIVASRRAVALCPNSAYLLCGLGVVLWDVGEYDEAEVILNRALELGPLDARLQANLAGVYSATGRGLMALDASMKAMVLNPADIGARWNHSVRLLDWGRWEEGFNLYDSRFEFRGPQWYPRLPYQTWTGEDLVGKTLFVHGEQGIGDRILMSRYVYWVAKKWPSCKVKFLLDTKDLPTLLPLLWGFTYLPNVELLPAGIPWPKADYGIYLGSLPRVHGSRPGSVPTDPGTIRRRAEEMAGDISVPPPHADALKIGIAWTGNNIMGRNNERSIPFETMLELEALPNIQLYSLQFDPGRQDLFRCGGQELAYDCAGDIGFRGYVGTAAVILNLDLIITVCTSVAHLAGALGVPCWTLLCANPYWVWGKSGDTSMWYPTMRLFRQDKMGDWLPVINRVKAELLKKTPDLVRLAS